MATLLLSLSVCSVLVTSFVCDDFLLIRGFVISVTVPDLSVIVILSLSKLNQASKKLLSEHSDDILDMIFSLVVKLFFTTVLSTIETVSVSVCF